MTIQERLSALATTTEEIGGKNVVTLNIPDDFEYMDEELQDILRSYVEEYL